MIDKLKSLLVSAKFYTALFAFGNTVLFWVRPDLASNPAFQPIIGALNAFIIVIVTVLSTQQGKAFVKSVQVAVKIMRT